VPTRMQVAMPRGGAAVGLHDTRDVVASVVALPLCRAMRTTLEELRPSADKDRSLISMCQKTNRGGTTSSVSGRAPELRGLSRSRSRCGRAVDPGAGPRAAGD